MVTVSSQMKTDLVWAIKNNYLGNLIHNGKNTKSFPPRGFLGSFLAPSKF